MKHLKLGIIGLSEGNGHPYSWAAILNGYNKKVMNECPFPAIPTYLAKQNFPDDMILDARVTHIWTQDHSISEHVATATNIDYVVDHFESMIGNVDGILLARDDAEKHYEMSAPFIKAGLPIYIDKPLARSVEAAKMIFSLEQYEGQIFTCSALRYAKEFQLSKREREDLGTIRYVDACVMKSWEKYGIHLIEPILSLLGNQGQILNVKSSGQQDKRVVTVSWKSGIQATFVTLGDISAPITIRLFCDNGFKEMVFEDNFYAFKEALKVFVKSIKNKRNPISKQSVLDMVSVIEQGCHE